MARVPVEKSLGEMFLEAMKPVAEQGLRTLVKAGARAGGAILEDGARIAKKTGARLAQKASQCDEVARRAEGNEHEDGDDNL